ncbi:sulfite exporter TauE/SafE family protein [Flavonifractor sp. An100]|uniref:sulfite exporter TauE/SafE family protein n=1 Tax=Flavonifractor sp. An100 TaxID=1965538 RepID=UPI000B3A23F7|nr:sulfite exporter TauE/SafE family protein [Flavonifractor sp. An100]OUQ76131.1 hypothetical protein B5E43_12385 [Flavonifractor sp. An100]
MGIIIFAICLAASTIGGICGIGGGVIIKPVLDALHIMSVSSISFLSGLSVLSMSVVSMIKQRKSHLVELRTGSLLALGAVLGGIAGNAIFQQLKAMTQDQLVGMVQAIVLAIITILTLVYSAFLRSRLPSYQVHNPVATVLLGLLMGVLSAFLGIGGGPINLAILYFAFSMDTKKAAANSLYIIMFSQASSFLTSCIQRTIPEFELIYLVLMVAAGILGGMLGSKINKRISAATTDKLFAGLLLVIVFICFYNAWRFAP